jgi:hypothetical protein
MRGLARVSPIQPVRDALEIAADEIEQLRRESLILRAENAALKAANGSMQLVGETLARAKLDLSSLRFTPDNQPMSACFAPDELALIVARVAASLTGDAQQEKQSG